MFVNASPVAVNNKIRAIQTRKSRITLQSYYDFTDIRPIHPGKANGITKSSGNFSGLSPEKLVERSRELRRGRLNERQNHRQSTLSSTNHTSFVWPSYESPVGFTKQSQVNSSRISPTVLGQQTNKSSNVKMPDIQQRLNRARTAARQPLVEQQNSAVNVEQRHKSLPKTKSSIPKAYNRTALKSKSPYPMPSGQQNKEHAVPQIVVDTTHNNNNNNNIIGLCKSEEIDENFFCIDEDFDKYVQKAIVKCAEWLLKYVFDKKYDEIDEYIF